MQKLLRELFDSYYRDVYAYLCSMCRDPQLAEDLAAETFLQAVRSAAGFRGQSSGKTWLFSIARHCWFAHLRRARRMPGEDSPGEASELAVPSAEDCVCEKEPAERAQQLLALESERTQGIVRMRLQGYSFFEIACRYGISESSARVIDFRARAKIQKALEKEGFYGG